MYIACSLNAVIKCSEIDYSRGDNNVIIVIIAQDNRSILESRVYYYWRQYIGVRETTLSFTAITRSIVSQIRSLDTSCRDTRQSTRRFLHQSVSVSIDGDTVRLDTLVQLIATRSVFRERGRRKKFIISAARVNRCRVSLIADNRDT